MKLKTYRAPTMADALGAVKKDLGRHAVILHTRTVKKGGFLGLSRKTFIEVTASDESPSAVRRHAPVAPPPASPPSAAPLAAPMAERAYRAAASPTPSRAAEPPPSPAKPADAPLRPTFAAPLRPVEPVLLPVRQRRPGQADAPSAPRPVSPLSPFAPADPASATSIYRELADIKLLVSQVLNASPVSAASTACGAMPEALFKHYLGLLEAAVSRDIADVIVGAVRDELTPAELADEAIVRTTVLRHLAGLIPVADPALRSGRSLDGRPLTIALVGPTGVGKTTTIAKLAAAYKLRQGKSVALITSDTYRIAAVDQLRTYAGIIGLPVRVVMTPDDMQAAVADFAQHDVILIDSAGRSQNATDRLAELAEFLAAADPHEVHLVLSTTASEEVLARTASAFSVVRPNRVILTKLDEAVNFGVIVNIARRLSASLSFVTTGQEVPDHIEPGRPDRLARMILDNGLAPPVPLAAARRHPADRSTGGFDAERAELFAPGAAL